MTNQLEQVCKLLEISRGDIGRLEHIKYTLQKGKSLYNSDEKYLQELSIKYLIKNAIQNEDIKENNTKKLKNTCYVCDKEIYGSDKFSCPYCDGLFCDEHRILENHLCVGLHNASAPRRNEGYISHHKPIIAETPDNLEIYPTIKKRKFKGNNPQKPRSLFWLLLPFFLGILGTIILHFLLKKDKTKFSDINRFNWFVGLISIPLLFIDVITSFQQSALCFKLYAEGMFLIEYFYNIEDGIWQQLRVLKIFLL